MDIPNDDKAGYVYFIRSEELSRIKIGFSTDPVERFRDLYTGASGRLVIIAVMPGCRATERYLHDALRQ